MNILIIEDDAIMRKIISHRLLEQGYTIATANNGAEAITAIESGNYFNVIMVDVMMPELSGPSFLIKLRHYFNDKPPKIIVVSGIHDGEVFLKKLGTDYDHFVRKPIDFDYLNGLLKEMASNI